MRSWSIRLLACCMASAVLTAAAQYSGVLDEHPSIQYATRPTSDRIQTFIRRGGSLQRDARTGYLRSLLAALDVPAESQLLIFSKTGVQREYTTPRTPRALYFDQSVVVGYIPGAPAIEIAAHDPQQGVVFYTLDQNANPAVPVRRTHCLACHVSASTLNVPGIIARSNFVGEDGHVLPQLGAHDVDHQTGHPDRWGGWFVTSVDGPPPYAQRAHQGNITFTLSGNTSNQVFNDWIMDTPEERGYLLPSSDVVALLAFDHQSHAINLMTRLNWESRVAAHDGGSSAMNAEVRRLIDELSDYLLFAGEASMPAALKPLPGFARRLESSVPKDSKGRSFGQLDVVDRLLRYPCSYMIYSDAFNGLPTPVRQTIYARMIDTLSGPTGDRTIGRVSIDDRRAILEILRGTKPDFPR